MGTFIFLIGLLVYFLLINRLLGFLSSSKGNKVRGILSDTNTNGGNIINFLLLLSISTVLSFITYFFIWMN